MKIGLNLKLLLNISALTTAIALIGCEIPETVTVKSEPNMKLPVGQVDPLKMADDNQGIDFDEFLFADSIEKQLQDSAIDPLTGKTTFKGKVYQYPDTNKVSGYHTGKADGVQSYLITYPIQEMDLDLTGYMKTPERQPAPIPLMAGYTGNGSLPPVQLGSMADWVRRVEIDRGAGIILKDAANLQGTITICIPQFWGDTYKTGTIAGNDLVFFTNETDI
ncbi:MAG: hypothetical protein LBT16_05415, partial [Treponema sp.]|nr:hypothetical protein [Treponema sp.]